MRWSGELEDKDLNKFRERKSFTWLPIQLTSSNEWVWLEWVRITEVVECVTVAWSREFKYKWMMHKVEEAKKPSNSLMEYFVRAVGMFASAVLIVIIVLATFMFGYFLAAFVTSILGIPK